MGIERIKQLLKQRESISLEFKEATKELPGNLFESICAMLNREGGDILLGVKDDGTVRNSFLRRLFHWIKRMRL
jgi:ATP-dependent DNA helicase RecG